MKPSRLRSALRAGMLLIGTAWIPATAAVDIPMPEAGMPALEAIVKSALANSSRVVAQDFELLNAQYQELIASSRLYPQVGGSYQYQFRQEDYSNLTDSQINQRTYYDLSASQAIWHWGAVRAGAQHGTLGRKAAEQSLEALRRALSVEVREAYLGLVVQKMGVRNALFGEKMASENLARQEARLNASEVTAGVVVDARLRSDETSLAARKAASDLDFTIRAFRRLTGVADFSDAEIPEQILAPLIETPNVAMANSSGYLNSEALLVNEIQIAQWKLVQKVERKALWPKLNAVVGVAQDDNLYSSELSQNLTNAAAFAGIHVNWTIFDGFAAKGRRLQSVNRIRQLERVRSDLIETLKESSIQLAANVGFAWSGYKHASLRQQFAAAGLAFEKENLERGLSSEDRIAASQAGLYQAELVANDALARFYTAAARYASSINADPLIDGTNRN